MFFIFPWGNDQIPQMGRRPSIGEPIAELGAKVVALKNWLLKSKSTLEQFIIGHQGTELHPDQIRCCFYKSVNRMEFG